MQLLADKIEIFHLFEHSATFTWKRCLSRCQVDDCKTRTPHPQVTTAQFTGRISQNQPNAKFLLAHDRLASTWENSPKNLFSTVCGLNTHFALQRPHIVLCCHAHLTHIA